MERRNHNPYIFWNWLLWIQSYDQTWRTWEKAGWEAEGLDTTLIKKTSEKGIPYATIHKRAFWPVQTLKTPNHVGPPTTSWVPEILAQKLGKGIAVFSPVMMAGQDLTCPPCSCLYNLIAKGHPVYCKWYKRINATVLIQQKHNTHRGQ